MMESNLSALTSASIQLEHGSGPRSPAEGDGTSPQVASINKQDPTGQQQQVHNTASVISNSTTFTSSSAGTSTSAARMARVKLVLGSIPREEDNTNRGFGYQEEISDGVDSKGFDGSVWFQYRSNGSTRRTVQLVNSSGIPFEEGTVLWCDIQDVGDVMSAQLYVESTPDSTCLDLVIESLTVYACEGTDDGSSIAIPELYLTYEGPHLSESNLCVSLVVEPPQTVYKVTVITKEAIGYNDPSWYGSVFVTLRGSNGSSRRLVLRDVTKAGMQRGGFESGSTVEIYLQSADVGDMTDVEMDLDTNGNSGWGLHSIGFQDVRSGASAVFPWRTDGRMGYRTGRETLSEPGQSEQRLTLHVGPDQDCPVFDGSVYVQLSGANGVFCEEVELRNGDEDWEFPAGSARVFSLYPNFTGNVKTVKMRLVSKELGYGTDHLSVSKVCVRSSNITSATTAQELTMVQPEREHQSFQLEEVEEPEVTVTEPATTYALPIGLHFYDDTEIQMPMSAAVTGQPQTANAVEGMLADALNLFAAGIAAGNLEEPLYPGVFASPVVSGLSQTNTDSGLSNSYTPPACTAPVFNSPTRVTRAADNEAQNRAVYGAAYTAPVAQEPTSSSFFSGLLNCFGCCSPRVKSSPLESL